jgi:hypothetical protein
MIDMLDIFLLAYPFRQAELLRAFGPAIDLEGRCWEIRFSALPYYHYI